MNRKTLAAATVFGCLTLSLTACEDGQVSVSGDTAKGLACSSARAANSAGAVSDDMRKSLARAIAESVSSETVQDLARRIEQSDTPEKLRASFDEMIDTACGPETP